MTTELDALPETEAIRMLSMFIDTAVGTRVTMHTTRIKEVRAELLRLTARVQELERENGELREQSRIAHSRWSEFAQLSGAEQRKRISAKAELAAIKKRIADAVHVVVREDTSPWSMADRCAMIAISLPTEMIGKRVALLPLDDEAKS